MSNRVKELIGLNAKLAVLSDLVCGYSENFVCAGVFFYWDYFEGCKNVGVRRICECREHITLL